MTNDTIRKIAEDIIKSKLIAIGNKDLDLYMSTISEKSIYYPNEQRKWFNDVISDEIIDFKLTIESVKLKNNGDISCRIRQTHKCIDNFDITYPLKLSKEEGIYKDCGCDFIVVENPKYKLMYLEGDNNYIFFNSAIKHSIERVETIFNYKLPSKIELKLFHNKELLRQRVLPTIKWQFLGWGEADESLKFYSGLDKKEYYKGLIQHELVHMITLPLNADKTPSWLNEGIATWFGYMDYPFIDNLGFDELSKYNYANSIDSLETFDLYNETDMNAIGAFYITSAFLIGYITEVYGFDKLIELYKSWEEPGDQSIKTILGTEKKKLSKLYLKWLNEQHFDEKEGVSLVY